MLFLGSYNCVLTGTYGTYVDIYGHEVIDRSNIVACAFSTFTFLWEERLPTLVWLILSQGPKLFLFYMSI